MTPRDEEDEKMELALGEEKRELEMPPAITGPLSLLEKDRDAFNHVLAYLQPRDVGAAACCSSGMAASTADVGLWSALYLSTFSPFLDFISGVGNNRVLHEYTHLSNPKDAYRTTMVFRKARILAEREQLELERMSAAANRRRSCAKGPLKAFHGPVCCALTVATPFVFFLLLASKLDDDDSMPWTAVFAPVYVTAACWFFSAMMALSYYRLFEGGAWSQYSMWRDIHNTDTGPTFAIMDSLVQRNNRMRRSRRRQGFLFLYTLCLCGSLFLAPLLMALRLDDAVEGDITMWMLPTYALAVLLLLSAPAVGGLTGDVKKPAVALSAFTLVVLLPLLGTGAMAAMREDDTLGAGGLEAWQIWLPVLIGHAMLFNGACCGCVYQSYTEDPCEGSAILFGWMATMSPSFITELLLALRLADVVDPSFKEAFAPMLVQTGCMLCAGLMVIKEEFF
eukprot:CAMPEP_0198421532 /NCGR_PEP_ID=MMETSP1452-20131203/1711_1 /TAXON_ID=1181717 /ORGANISM="Synchroma pusillum, Strain CCMP3072" /LENGTH=450 /DNA_ID=CAMNT_0044141747 /DNA_START=11 /DNA_END=1363 /DNA_ORIENTATION=+